MFNLKELLGKGRYVMVTREKNGGFSVETSFQLNPRNLDNIDAVTPIASLAYDGRAIGAINALNRRVNPTLITIPTSDPERVKIAVRETRAIDSLGQDVASLENMTASALEMAIVVEPIFRGLAAIDPNMQYPDLQLQVSNLVDKRLDELLASQGQ